MCMQCLVNPHYYGEVLPGWYLIRARRECDEMKVGQWGLLEVNDPTFIWTETPKDKGEDGGYPSDDFGDALFCTPEEGHRLIEAAKEMGFDRGESGPFSWWLFRHLGKWIEEHEPTVDTDPFPQLDQIQPHDYSLGKD